MSSLSCKNVKIQDSTGTLVSTLSYDGTNVTIDKPVLAPTALADTNNTQLATTAMVHSAITNDLHATGSAPMYACRAWLNYSGSSSTINASGNISSVVKNSTGQYTVNFTNAMPDTNYVVSGSGALINSKIQIYITGGGAALKTTSAQIETATSGGGTNDSDADTLCVAIHR
jgi:hypothetical protein